MIIEWIQECDVCEGTGLYVGLAEKNGAAVVCNDCEGSGRQHIKREYQEFKGQKHREDITRVFATTAGIVIAPEITQGGVPYEVWKHDPQSVKRPGAELREFSCPAHWAQCVGTKRPEWKECVTWGQSFFKCEHFPIKSQCWERLDRERKGKEHVS